ncbi:MAG TPA: OB-fold nucleic acid binding domain-containing protein, partial [Flavisolibacter sp.]
ICAADTIGVFQIESRAQQSMLPRLKPRCFYDLVIEVAIVRPGPIQGDMVHPYLRRRDKIEAEEYPSEELRKILEKTKGVPLFQEQAMNIAIVAANFTPTEADELRRSMATFKAKGVVSRLRDKLVAGMVKKGYEKDFAERIFKQLEGFGSYGFPESHAASFALLVYVSSWIKCHHPDVFAAALLNSQPMGFYRPAQIVIDARNHQVKVREIDINYSYWDNTLENIPGERCALRLGFRQVKGLREEEVQILIAARTQSFTHIHQLLEAGISHTALEKLADADAFRSIGFDRRQAFWEASALADRPVGLFHGQPLAREADVDLPAMSLSEHVIHDYATTSLSLKQHPVGFVREQLNALGVVSSKSLGTIADGKIVKVAGLVLVRQRPGTASGICFITIEDETGTANLVVFQNLFDTYRKEVLRSKLLMVEGKVQKEGAVIHVVVSKCINASGLLRKLGPNEEHEPEVLTLSRADEKDEYESQAKGRKLQPRRNVQAEIFPASRDFR